MKQCAICQKKWALAGRLKKLRGKYNPTQKRKQHPNLQWFWLTPEKRILACTKCIKKFSKKK